MGITVVESEDQDEQPAAAEADDSEEEETGRAVARRNLWVSIPCLLLAFAVWMVWSVVVVNLPSIGFKFTTDQLFWPNVIRAFGQALVMAPATESIMGSLSADKAGARQASRTPRITRFSLPPVPGCAAGVSPAAVVEPSGRTRCSLVT